MSTTQIYSVTALAINVRLVAKGDVYGRNDSFRHDREEPLVEFYSSDVNDGPLGQFIARFYTSSLLSSQAKGKHLPLDGRVLKWSIDAGEFSELAAWMRDQGPVATFLESHQDKSWYLPTVPSYPSYGDDDEEESDYLRQRGG